MAQQIIKVNKVNTNLKYAIEKFCYDYSIKNDCKFYPNSTRDGGVKSIGKTVQKHIDAIYFENEFEPYLELMTADLEVRSPLFFIMQAFSDDVNWYELIGNQPLSSHLSFSDVWYEGADKEERQALGMAIKIYNKHLDSTAKFYENDVVKNVQNGIFNIMSFTHPRMFFDCKFRTDYRHLKYAYMMIDAAYGSCHPEFVETFKKEIEKLPQSWLITNYK